MHQGQPADSSDSTTVVHGMAGRKELLGRKKNGEEFLAKIAISECEIDGENIFTAVIKDITITKRTEEAIKNIVVGISASIGDTFFDAITEQLAKTLDADFIIVGKLVAERQAISLEYGAPSAGL